MTEVWASLANSDLLSFLAKGFLTLFVLIDPVGIAPIFMSLAGEKPPADQARIARQAVLIAAGILVAFTFGGNGILRYLGISMAAFQVAAGLLLLKIAVEMVFESPSTETNNSEKPHPAHSDIGVFPLAIPLIAGPGTMAALPVLVDEAHAFRGGVGWVLGLTGLVLAIAYVLLIASQWVSRSLGPLGINVITRILGVLLTALAVQTMANGILELFPQIGAYASA